MDKFVDRDAELLTLEKEYARQESSFVVIYGRRRVGKTSLISRFCQGKSAIQFLASQESEAENRNALKEVVGEFYQDSLLLNAKLDRWEDLFAVIAARSREAKARTVIVLDEFQYLGKANKAFPSVFMNIWDTMLSGSNVMVILSGSLINMMMSQVLSYDSPLYGRRTAQIRLGQIPFRYYGDFYGDSRDQDQLIQRYAVTGGVPKYIRIFEECEDIYQGIEEHVLSPNSYLYAEPEFLLQKEVTEIGSYFSILKTIAAGNHKLSKIAAVLEAPQTSLTKYLKVLIELDLLERRVPITEENAEKSKRGLYFIKDNFINFWFRYVYPYRGFLETGHTEYVLEKIRESFISSHVAGVYEEVCREDVWSIAGDRPAFNRVGRWWGERDVEIDIVAYDSHGFDILFGECKYSVNPKGMEVLADLRAKALSVNWKKAERREFFVIYSRNGFTRELKEYAVAVGNVMLKELI